MANEKMWIVNDGSLSASTIVYHSFSTSLSAMKILTPCRLTQMAKCKMAKQFSPFHHFTISLFFDSGIANYTKPH